MSSLTSLALFAALVLVVGNWVLEACAAGARQHRAMRRESR